MRRMLLFAVVVVGGCLEAEDDMVQFAEDFENGVDAWNRAGEVSIVTTNHPGEHAVWLAPGASIEHALQIDRAYDTESDPWNDGFTDGNWIEYTSDCSGRPALTLEPMTLPPGDDNQLRVRLVMEGPPEPGFARTKLMFPALPAFVVEADLRFTSLLVGAEAPCHLDNLRVMVSGGTIGY